jgi:hypothetical protein
MHRFISCPVQPKIAGVPVDNTPVNPARFVTFRRTTQELRCVSGDVKALPAIEFVGVPSAIWFFEDYAQREKVYEHLIELL